jgi:TolB-like protein/Tfp pilus assembly protein PilF
VAVLPFDNLGPSPQQDYFVDGITRDLITDLSKLAGLEVIAPGSTFVYRNAQPDVRQAGESLRADYIVRGSVQRSGQRLRINAQLIAVDDERAVWAERLDTTLEHVFRVQDQIARGVVGALRLALVADQPLHHGAASIAAYDALLLGLEAYGHRSPDGNQLAREHLEQAVALDPGYARAHAGLALVYAREAIDGWTPTPAESLRRAEQQAQTALKLDPAMSQGYFVQGQVALFQGRQADAIAAAERAITIDPSYADAYALSAWILNFAGRPDQALQALASAESLNPITPLSYREILGEIRFAQGRYAEAIEHLGEVVQQNPGHQRAIMWLAAALARQGRLEDARWEVEKLRLSLEDGTPGPLAFALPFKDPRIRDELLRSLEQAGWGPEPL